MATGIKHNDRIDFPYANSALLKAGFEKGGFLPSTANESWKYTNLISLSKIPFDTNDTNNLNLDINHLSTLDQHAASSYQIFFVNGKVVNIDEVSKMMPKDVSVSINDSNSNKIDSDNSLLNMNFKLNGDRLKINIGSKIHLTKPISLIFYTLNEGNKPIASHPGLEIILEEEASATIIEQHLFKSSQQHWTNTLVDVDIRKGAILKHYKLELGTPTTWCTSYIKVLLNETSKYYSFSLLRGSKLSRNEVHSLMEGNNGECYLHGAHLLDGDQHADTTSIISHNAPNCKSKKLYRGVLDEKSRGVAQAQVKVAQNAQKTDAEQLLRTILLSPSAEIKAKPELEIFADDVKCSHGATSGSLDSESLFYLRSRGLSEVGAKKLLILAFMNEHFQLIDNESIQNLMSNVVSKWLSSGKRRN
tara:strand:+ start:208 stop:1461 length:1254 start_codon:yes stop_codon:yes gene_type:complete